MTKEYDQDDVCEHIASGKSLVSWCKKTGVSYTRIMVDLRKDVDFQQKYAYAREDQADYLADEIIEISDDVSKDITVDAEGKPVIDGFGAQRARLMVDTRKWAASKMKPKKYGESSTLRGDPEAPLFDPVSLVKALDGRSSGLPEIKG